MKLEQNNLHRISFIISYVFSSQFNIQKKQKHFTINYADAYFCVLLYSETIIHPNFYELLIRSGQNSAEHTVIFKYTINNQTFNKRNKSENLIELIPVRRQVNEQIQLS